MCKYNKIHGSVNGQISRFSKQVSVFPRKYFFSFRKVILLTMRLRKIMDRNRFYSQRFRKSNQLGFYFTLIAYLMSVTILKRNDFWMKHILLVQDHNHITSQIIQRMLHSLQSLGYSYSTTSWNTDPNELHPCDIPIFINSGNPSNTLFMDYLIQCQIPYIYYIDNNCWKIPSLKNNFPLIRTLNLLIANAWGVIVNSQDFADELSLCHDHVVSLPSYYDFTLLDPVEKKSHPSEIRIGFASQRWLDLLPLVPTIQRILNQYQGKVVLELFGDIPDRFRHLEGVRQFDTILNYVEYSKFQYSRGWNIGFAPLMPTEANQSKTNNKYREYGACGIAGIYSQLAPYTNCVQHRQTGLIVDHSLESWYSALVELIENPQFSQFLGINAEQDIRKNHSIETALPQWQAFFDSIPTGEGKKRFKTVRTRYHRFIEAKFQTYLYRLFLIFISLRFMYSSKPIHKIPKAIITKIIKKVRERDFKR